MNILEIISRENDKVKQYAQLAGSRKERHKQGLFVTEGIKLTGEAFDAGCAPMALFITRDALECYEEPLRKIVPACVRLYQISQPVADKLAQSVSPQGVFAVFRMLDKDFQPVKISSNGRFILLSSLQDPGNIGTILRTAAAFEMDAVVLSADCPDIYSLKVLRSAMGGVFRVPVSIAESLESVIDMLRQSGIAVYAAALDEAAVPVHEVPMRPGCAVVIGNEGNGISPELAARCDRSVMIPMREGSESLNAAMAAGIFMWEMARQRSGW